LLFKKYMDPLFTVAAIMAAFIVVNSEDLVLLFAGPEYVDAAAALSVIGLYTLHQTYGQMTGGFLLAVNKSKLYANIGLIMLLLDVILVLLFVYYLNFGSYGMALKMLIVNIVGSNVMLYYVAKIINTNIKPMLLNQLTITVVFLLIAFLEKSIVSFSDNIIIDTIVSGSIYLIMSILFIFIFPRIVGISYARRRGILSLLRLNR